MHIIRVFLIFASYFTQSGKIQGDPQTKRKRAFSAGDVYEMMIHFAHNNGSWEKTGFRLNDFKKGFDFKRLKGFEKIPFAFLYVVEKKFLQMRNFNMISLQKNNTKEDVIENYGYQRTNDGRINKYKINFGKNLVKKLAKECDIRESDYRILSSDQKYT